MIRDWKEDSKKDFVHRHIGPSSSEQSEMLLELGYKSEGGFLNEVIPDTLKLSKEQEPVLPLSISENDFLTEIKEMMEENRLFRNFLGMGFYPTIVPPVIKRSLLENPGWYTQYTPYQSEISQGRLESLLNFQTAVSDLTGLPFSNASLLDDSTAAAESMGMFYRLKGTLKGSLEKSTNGVQRNKLFLSLHLHPHIISVVETRALPLGIEVVKAFSADVLSANKGEEFFGAIVSYPHSNGGVQDLASEIAGIKKSGIYVAVCSDLMSLPLLKPPGECGADVAFGNSQRLGVPLGYGGPHAAFISCNDAFKRQLPGRVIGVSKDAQGNNAYRMAMQTREQHIRRDKATSNICTAQALLANMVAMYCVYHGPEGLLSIASEIHKKTCWLYGELQKINKQASGKPLQFVSDVFFDTITLVLDEKDRMSLIKRAQEKQMNFRTLFPFEEAASLFGAKKLLGMSLDEVTSSADLDDIVAIFRSVFLGEEGKSEKVETEGKGAGNSFASHELTDKNSASKIIPPFQKATSVIPNSLKRTSKFLTHPIFNSIRSEHQMQRYLTRLERKDISLVVSMIPLGSCTMKLNASVEMMPLSSEYVGNLHPFAPLDQAFGYAKLFARLEEYLKQITGFDAFSLQPNSGAQGEYAGLLTIRNYFLASGAKGEERTIVLIPSSAHGTNPASATMAGMDVVVIACEETGNISMKDVEEKIAQYGKKIAALMITYPSTYGVYEKGIEKICAKVHEVGAQVYLDGANMNAQVGYTNPKKIGADVCHLNLHKTFAIPHGGGGPGVGPIGVAKHLQPYLPGHMMIDDQKKNKVGPVASAPWGSASILTISYAYIRLLGLAGLKKATAVSILNANYIRKRLEKYFKVLFKSEKGLVAHEMIIDARPFKSCGVTAEDIAKRLIDYGFHAPTMSWPVEGTLMIEPTESEDKAELDRFCDALISIGEEIKKIENNVFDKKDNPLKNAPHTMKAVTAEKWDHCYSREVAAFPLPYVSENKFWPPVARVDNVYGDRNLICSCPPMKLYERRVV